MKNILVGALFMLVTSVWGQNEGFIINEYVVNMDLSKAGDLTVEEEIQVNFTDDRRGIFRDIPYKYYDPEGKLVNVKISEIEVPGQQTKIERNREILRIRIGDPDRYLRGLQSYTIRYKIEKAFISYDDRIELVLNVIPHFWPVQISGARFSLTMPDDLIVYDEDIQTLTGKSGAADTGISTVKKTGPVISGEITTPLPPNNGLTLAVNLPVDYFPTTVLNNQSPAENEIPEDNRNDSGFWIIGLLGAIFGWLFKKYGRNHHRPETPITYYPPEGMSAPEVGTFIDFQANTRDLVSLLPKWGNEGLVEINSIESAEGKRELYFVKKKDIPALAPAYEKTMFSGLFDDRSQIFLKDLQEKYYTTLAKAKSLVKEEILNPRLYDPLALKYFHNPWNIILAVFLIIISIVLIIKYKWIVSGVLLILFALGIIIIKFIRPKLSPEGLTIHHQLVALKDFLKEPDPEELQRLQNENPNYLDFIFPYVVAFGIDKSWNEKLTQTEFSNYIPAWYIYHTDQQNFSTPTYADFSSSFDIPTIQSTFTSAPVSSGGSSGGSFGGGVSGGGVGGGGGGSW